MELSVCIITKNEAARLQQCLEALYQYDFELIVVDTGSTDQTKEIAGQYTEHIYDYTWCGDFSAARNYSISKATKEYVLIVDTDEVVTEIDIKRMQQILLANPNAVGRVERINVFTRDGQEERLCERINRIFQRKQFCYTGSIHEQVTAVDGKEYQMVDVPVVMEHRGYDGDAQTRRKKAERNIKLLQEQLSKEGADSYVLYQLGKSYYMQEDYGKSIVYFEQATSFDLNPKLEYVLDLVTTYGYALLKTEQYEKALLFESIYEAFSYSADFVFLMGLIYMNHGEFESAIQEFQKATGYSHCHMTGVNSYKANYNIGVIYQCLGNAKQAEAYYSQCGAYAPAADRLRELKE